LPLQLYALAFVFCIKSVSQSVSQSNMPTSEGEYFAYMGRRNPLMHWIQILFAYITGIRELTTCLTFGDDRLRGLELAGCQSSHFA